MKNIKHHLLFFLFGITSLFALDVTENTTLHGFGTLGGSYNTNEHFIYRENVSSKSGSSDDFSFATHSKLGLQLDTNVNNQLKATIQGVTYQKEAGKLQADLDWAYLKYSPTDYLNFKFGRMKIPFFIFSDSSNINYTNVWTHPPKETVIASVPFSSYNGVEAEYLFSLSEHNISLQSYLGAEKGEVYGANDYSTTNAEIKNAYGFSIPDYYGDIKGRGTYFTGDIKFQNNDVDKLLSEAKNPLLLAYFPNLSNAQNYDLSNLKMQLLALGFTYQFDNIFLASEYTSVDLNNKVIDDLRGWYVSTGYQFDKIMPYVTYGASKQKIGYPINDIPILPAQFGGNKFYDGFTTEAKSFNYAQESISFGVRYDVYKNVALKTQVDRIFYDENHRTMYKKDGAESPKGHLDVFSIALDFVF